MKALRSEFLKTFTTRTWWILALLMALYVAFTATILAFAFSGIAGLASEELVFLDSSDTARSVYSTALSVGYVFPLLVGALAVTGEFRHHTIVPTFLTIARRGTALGAKLISQCIIGFLFGLIAFGSTIIAALIILTANGHTTGLGEVETWLMILRGVVAMGIWAMIGVGLGSLVPNQAAVLVIAIAFTQFLEPILRMVAMFSPVSAKIGSFLPGAASDAFCGSSAFSVMQMGSSSLQWWAGCLVLLAYAGVFAALGYLLRWRRDVD
ncbi:ABC transporter permease subunit [Actinomycetaceae bacterium WB03_NA08]|uniref:ABC transporter permease subunit n=1 Tax=Scrofimicrobium canadense TaxID=2652290 RepID=A0A6N7W863_9ACTO|nr:ABC transporter permease subunit [Scrofimicrobium canadense]MSS84456.1 ABC transporter permease subunit [Scrofimicrobium canadense]